MKHVFTIHSPITFLAAHATIHALQLDYAEVIILTNNYVVPVQQYKTYPFFANIQTRWYQKLLAPNVPVQEDKYITKITGGQPFTAYVDLMYFSQAVLVTHPHCLGFNFIEEGNSSYRKGDDFKTLTWQWAFIQYPLRVVGFRNRIRHILLALRWAYRGYSHRFLAIPNSFTSYAFFPGVKFYGFSPLAYPDIDEKRKVVLTLDHTVPWIADLAAKMRLSNKIIWVDGANSRFTGLPDAAYERAIDKAIDCFKDELSAKGVYLKLRPRTSNFDACYLYQALSRQGINITVLPDDMVLECLFVTSSNCTVIGNLSSALFYASVFGHSSYSIFSLYEQQVPTIFDMMPGYWQMVKKVRSSVES